MNSKPAILNFLLALVFGLVGFGCVVSRLDIGGDYPNANAGPGMTLDEPFNVTQGVYLNRAIGEFGPAVFTPTNASAVFENDSYMSDYPPLGRLWLGTWHDLTLSLFPVEGSKDRIVMTAARVGSAAAFGLLLSLIVFTGSHWYGRFAGICGGACLLLMPRVFGHAQIASVESIMNLTWTLTVLYVGSRWVVRKPVSNSVAVIAGILFGIAMLTKIQGILLSVPLGVWAVLHWRQRAIVPLVVLGLSALLTFVILWPWLWFDPFPRFMEYAGRATERVTLHTFYNGVRFEDTNVPWHYPFVMFCATMPIGILVAGCIGSFAGLKHARERLLLLCAAFPMCLFAVPGITVYDGIRLFLVSCPMWAMLAAFGMKCVADRYADQPARLRAVWVAVVAVVVFQGYGLWASMPVPLSYYNLLVGGLSGASQKGFEPTYWNDCLNRDFLNEIPNNSVVLMAPVLHPTLPFSTLDQNPLIKAKGIRLATFDYELDTETGYLLLVHRLADLPPRWQKNRDDVEIVSEMTHDGVVLARLVKIK